MTWIKTKVLEAVYNSLGQMTLLHQQTSIDFLLRWNEQLAEVHQEVSFHPDIATCIAELAHDPFSNCARLDRLGPMLSPLPIAYQVKLLPWLCIFESGSTYCNRILTQKHVLSDLCLKFRLD